MVVDDMWIRYANGMIFIDVKDQLIIKQQWAAYNLLLVRADTEDEVILFTHKERSVIQGIVKEVLTRLGDNYPIFDLYTWSGNL